MVLDIPTLAALATIIAFIVSASVGYGKVKAQAERIERLEKELETRAAKEWLEKVEKSIEDHRRDGIDVQKDISANTARIDMLDKRMDRSGINGQIHDH